MLGWLYRIVVGSFHSHKWETIDTTQLMAHDKKSGQDLPVGLRYHLRCTECGEIKGKSV